jgi:hypothetical protein
MNGNYEINITSRPRRKDEVSLKQRCKEQGVNYWRALKRRAAGMSNEKIFAPEYQRHNRKTNPITVNGVTYPNLEEAVRQCNPPAHSQTIARWIAAGADPDLAFTRIPNPGYRNGVVYLIFHPDTGKGYVGVSVREPSKRCSDHLEAAIAGTIKHQHSLHAAIRKYGAENFLVAVIDHVETGIDLGEKERMHIKNHQTLAPYGFNISPGGSIGGSTPKPRVFQGTKYDRTGDLDMHVAELKGISAAAAKWRVLRGRIDAKAPPKPGHGVCKTPAYKAWSGIIHCRANPASKHFRAGLGLFDGWRKFETFLADVGQPPSKGFALARIDQSRGYFPGNCVWLSRSEASKLNAAHMKKLGTLGNRHRRTASVPTLMAS